MTKAEATMIKAQVASAIVQLLMLTIESAANGKDVSVEGRKIGSDLGKFIDSLVAEISE